MSKIRRENIVQFLVRSAVFVHECKGLRAALDAEPRQVMPRVIEVEKILDDNEIGLECFVGRIVHLKAAVCRIPFARSARRRPRSCSSSVAIVRLGLRADSRHAGSGPSPCGQMSSKELGTLSLEETGDLVNLIESFRLGQSCWQRERLTAELSSDKTSKERSGREPLTMTADANGSR